ncbi:L-rhamnose mutarotase [Fulvivirgaceae bacterium BMA12]|uniref:L-rhamnose mutarotase n=1 Tax=Agaribacillus aureus TaxID=3051825 RepID=A0ABT8LK90_9BACT|nr:L-rhamnose mutarotase [Fulvivirgaceae bacterium BMA12]
MYKSPITKLSIISTLVILLAQCHQPGKSSKHKNELSAKDNNVVKRIGMVIRLREDNIAAYKKLHAFDNPGVRDLLSKYNMRNFSIFLHKLDDGKYYEFGYYEYVGDDFEGDMDKLAAEPRNQAWLEICDPMQIPLQGYNSWAEMEQIYYNP